MEKLHKGATSLVFQLGTSDFRTGNSEDIKKAILKLLNEMKLRKVQVVLSGPIPYPRMANSTFSRMLAVHDWLMSLELSPSVTYVNNFDSLWQKPGLFAKTGTRLSDNGNIILKRNISTSLLN